MPYQKNILDGNNGGQSMDTMFSSNIFETEIITLAGTDETIVRGGRDKFNLLPKAFAGIDPRRPEAVELLEKCVNVLACVDLS